MKAVLILGAKSLVTRPNSEEVAFVDLKIWEIPKSEHYEYGRKFSLFLIADGRVIVGFDNHRPKGAHLHLGETEVPYCYVNDQTLVEDFWNLVRKAGFEP